MIWQLGQLVASLAAILVVTLLVWKLGLGSDIRLRDEDEARRLAGDALCGFNAVDVVLDRHGVHFAARLLDSHAGIRLDRNFLTIATAEKSFGTVTLDLGTQAQVWAGSLRRLGG